MTDKTPRAWDGALEQEFYTPEEIAASDARVGKAHRMLYREKVIEGLKNCTNECCATGETCPYYLNDDGDIDNECEVRLHKDALALLKAQEPHVIRFDEIDDYEVLWLEVRDVESEEGLAPWVKTRSGNWFSPLLCSQLQPDMILSTSEEYGKYCRCWTSRPTDEQREATPWA